MRRLARLVVRRRRLVVLAWVVLLAALAGPAGKLNDRISNGGYGVAGSQSQRVHDISARSFDGKRELLYVVLRGAGPSLRPDAERLRARLPAATRAQGAKLAGPPSIGRGTAVVPLSVPGSVAQVQKKVGRIQDEVRTAAGGRHVALLGEAAVFHATTEISKKDLSKAETLSLPITLAILLVAFLSAVAAAMPIVLALVGLGITFGVLSLIAQTLDMSVYVSNTATLLGLGLAIDYSLFVVSRYREVRATEPNLEQALGRTLETAGRAILVSGVTVALALASLAVMGVGVFGSMAIGASAAAAVAALGALTLLPALLAMLGPRIDRFQVRRAVRAADSGRLWERLSGAVLGRRRLVAGAAVLLFVACAAPLLGSRLQYAGTDVLVPKGNSVRTANDAVARDFGAGAVTPIVVLTNGQPATVHAELARVPGVRRVLPPQAGRGGWYRLTVVPGPPAGTPASDRLVRRLRERVPTVPGPGGRLRQVLVGGQAAEGVDLIDRIDSRFPLMILVASVSSLVLLLVAFRSIVVPIKAVLANLLSVGATLGLVALLFQDLGGSAGTAWFVPPFLFAIVFGLSMDYEIFLMSRVREEHLRGASNEQSITNALRRSGRAITLAALVIMTVFLSSGTAQVETFRQLGVGMALAVFLDATLIRCALVPATLALLGERNWWMPRALGRFLPWAGTPAVLERAD